MAQANRAAKSPNSSAAPSLEVILRNRQRIHPVDLRLARRLIRFLCREALQLQRVALGVHLVADPEITRLNEHFLSHAGPTDVITFDHRNPADRLELHGEIFIGVEVAARQARRFRTSVENEIARYLIHGLLHLLGEDDRSPKARRQMKRRENRLLRRVEIEFSRYAI
jgi:probable rRNA maturation factor